jgi:hypothetical protein
MAWGRAHARGMDEQIGLEDSVSRGVRAERQSRLCSYDPRLMQQCPYAVMEWRHGDQTCRYFSVALTDGGMEALCRRPRHIELAGRGHRTSPSQPGGATVPIAKGT